MIKTYEAQAVIAKHAKGYLARKQVDEIRGQRDRDRAESEEGATKIQGLFRQKKAKEAVKERKDEKVSVNESQIISQ